MRAGQSNQIKSGLFKKTDGNDGNFETNFDSNFEGLLKRNEKAYYHILTYCNKNQLRAPEVMQ